MFARLAPGVDVERRADYFGWISLLQSPWYYDGANGNDRGRRRAGLVENILIQDVPDDPARVSPDDYQANLNFLKEVEWLT
jgi:hypothetical protein